MGLGAQAGREAADGAGHMFVEQIPDPGHQAEDDQAGDAAGEDETVQQHGIPDPAIAEPEPGDHRAGAAQGERREEKKDAEPEAQLLKHRLLPRCRRHPPAAGAPRREAPSVRRAWR